MFFQKKIEKIQKGMHDINMTPLIDVSLVLVVMLLLTTPLAFESSIAVRHSKVSAKAAAKKEKKERIELRIISDTDVRVNRTRVNRDELGNALRPLLEKSDRRQVVVLCAEDVSHGVFVDVLDQAKLCGASDIAITERH
jgi:biopolymer transport protein ExbD